MVSRESWSHIPTASWSLLNPMGWWPQPSPSSCPFSQGPGKVLAATSQGQDPPSPSRHSQPWPNLSQETVGTMMSQLPAR